VKVAQLLPRYLLLVLLDLFPFAFDRAGLTPSHLHKQQLLLLHLKLRHLWVRLFHQQKSRL
jgi:hypothetical protein